MEASAWGAAVSAVLLVTAVLSLRSRRRRLDARERELDERERDLLERRGAVLDLLSHELRTPLFVIAGGLETLASGRAHGPEHTAELTAAVRRAALRIERQVTAVLAATDRAFDPPRPEPVRARELLDGLLSRFGRDEAARIRVAVDPCDLELVLDPRYTELLLLELVDNALKFGGRDEPVDLVVSLADGLVRFEVSDTGTTTVVDQRWFHPFHQEQSPDRRDHTGLGLGLTGATRLARRLGGDVRIDPRPSGGVTAVVQLPRSADVGDAQGAGREDGPRR